MRKMSFSIKTLSIFAVLILTISFLPVTPVQSAASFISLQDFEATLKKSDASQLVGVYVNDILALKVVQQASTYSVSTKLGTATQFGLAGKYGSIGVIDRVRLYQA